MSDSMRGLFFIVKGQHKKGVEPSFLNEVTNNESYIGGYDPENENTIEWYRLMDCKTFQCLSCNTEMEKVLDTLHNVIKRHKGDAKSYFRCLAERTGEEYYANTYLGRKTYSNSGVKTPTMTQVVSPSMKCLYGEVFERYGDYFSYEISQVEDLAYEELREENPVNKSRKLVSKLRPNKQVEVFNTPKEEVMETTPKRLARPKVKVGVKKLVMNE